MCCAAFFCTLMPLCDATVIDSCLLHARSVVTASANEAGSLRLDFCCELGAGRQHLRPSSTFVQIRFIWLMYFFF